MTDIEEFMICSCSLIILFWHHFYLISSLPHISFASIALPINDFRAHPVGGASDGLDASTRHADGLDTFAGSKVSQLYVPR